MRGQYLDAIEKTGLFKEQVVAIAPIRSGSSASVETDPLLSKDIRFLFEPNPATLDMSNQENIQNLEAIKKMLQVSPGSTMLLRGHVDNAQVPVFRQKGGEAYVRKMALSAMELSKNRAGEIRKLLIEQVTASIPNASTSSAAAGKSRPGPIRRRTAASKSSGSRSNKRRVVRGSTCSRAYAAMCYVRCGVRRAVRCATCGAMCDVRCDVREPE